MQRELPALIIFYSSFFSFSFLGGAKRRFFHIVRVRTSDVRTCISRVIFIRNYRDEDCGKLFAFSSGSHFRTDFDSFFDVFLRCEALHKHDKDNVNL